MARKKFYGSNTGKRSPSIQNSLIIELSDTSSEDSPIKKAAIQTRSSKNVGQSTLKAFESIRASTPMMTRTVNSNVIQRKFGGIRLRSGNILHKNVTTTDCSAIESLDNNVQPVVELQPIEIGDEPSQKMDFQVKVILERMTKKTIQKKMHNVNVAGVVQALTPTIQDDTFKINYKCWQWQPKLKLKQLTKNDLDGHMKSESSAGECRLVEPIKFDREEPVIRELSPETATKSYQQVSVSFTNNSVRSWYYNNTYKSD